MYLQSSLAFEIIYTVLNGVVQQLENKDLNVLIRKKTKQILKIQRMVDQAKSRSTSGVEYLGFDFYDEYIFRLKNNVVKNLDQLDDYAMLRRQSYQDETYEQLATDSSDVKVKSITLKRKVIIKQYAPKTFKKIR